MSDDVERLRNTVVSGGVGMHVPETEQLRRKVEALKAELAERARALSAHFAELEAALKRTEANREAILEDLNEARARAVAAYEDAAEFVRNHVYTNIGSDRALEPVAPRLRGMDQHHETIAQAILSLATDAERDALAEREAKLQARIERLTLFACSDASRVAGVLIGIGEREEGQKLKDAIARAALRPQDDPAHSEGHSDQSCDQ